MVLLGLDELAVAADGFTLAAAVERRPLGVHPAVAVAVADHLQRRIIVVVVVQICLHEQTSRAGAERVIGEVAPRRVALDLGAHALLAHGTQQLPPLALDRLDLVDGFHAVDVHHRRLGDPLAARAVAPSAGLRGRLQSPALHGAQHAQGRLRRVAPGVLASVAEEPDGVVGDLGYAVAALVDGDAAAVAGDELVKVKVAVVVAHRAPVHGPLHANHLVAPLLPVHELGELALPALLLDVDRRGGAFSLALAAVQPAPDRHPRRLDHAYGSLPLFRLFHPRVLLKLRRGQRLALTLALAALAQHLELADQEMGPDAVALNLHPLGSAHDVLNLEVLAPVRRAAIHPRPPASLRSLGLLAQQRVPLEVVYFTRLWVLREAAAHVEPAVFVHLVLVSLRIARPHLDSLDRLLLGAPAAVSLAVVEQVVDGQTVGLELLLVLSELDGFLRGEVLVPGSLLLGHVPPSLTLDLVQRRKVHILARVLHLVPLEEIGAEELPRGLWTTRDPARGFGVPHRRLHVPHLFLDLSRGD